MDLTSFEFGSVHFKFKGFQYKNTDIVGLTNKDADWTPSKLRAKANQQSKD
jgi:hypothetical protein